MATVDSLDIVIQTNVNSAIKSLDSLIQRMGLVSDSILEMGRNISEATKDFSSIQNVGKSISNSITPEMQKVSKSFEQISEKYKDLGKDFQFFGSAQSAQKKIDSLSNSLENAKIKKQELETAGKTEGQMYENAVKDVIKYKNQIESLKKTLESVNNVKASAEIIIDGGEYAKKLIIEYKKELLDFKNDIRSIGDAYEGLENIPKGMLDTPIENLKISISELKAEYPQATNVISDFEAELQRLQGVSEKLTAERIVPKVDVSEIKNKTSEASEALRIFRENLSQITVPEIREDNLEKLQSAFERTEQKLDELRTKLSNGMMMGSITESVDDKGFVRLQEQIAYTEKYAEALRAKLAELRSENIEAPVATEPYVIENANESVVRLGASLKDLQAAGNKLKSVLSGINATLKKINGVVNSVISKIKNFAKSMFSLGESAKNSGKGFNLNLKTILKYGFGIRSVYMLINKLRNGIKDGMKNFVQYSDETNASISILKSSIATLKNASAAAFSPLLNAIAPVVNEIIQLCIRATNAINQLFSAIFGNGTWIKAKNQIIDYADSLKSASGAAEKLRTITLGIDELNIISPDNEAGGGAGSSFENAADMFETLPIENKFSEIADTLKTILSQIFDPLQSAWNSNGKSVMDSWKNALGEIWSMIKDIGRDFLTVWTQEDTVSIFKNILTIIDDIGKSISNIANNFKDAWNTNEVGLHIFENIRDVIGVIIENLKHAADFTVEWSDNLDFVPLLEAFSGFANSLIPVVDSLSGVLADFYEKVLLPLGKWTLEKGLPKLIDVFTALNKKIDWKKLRDNLAKLWEHLEPFAETVGEGLIIFIERVSGLVENFLNSDTFVNFLQDLGNWMDNVTPEDVADGITKLAEAFIALKIAIAGFGILSTISGMFSIISTTAMELSTIFSGLSSFTTEFSASLAGLSTSVTVIAAVIAAFVAGLAITYEKNEEVKQSFDDAISSIRDGLQPALELIANRILPDLNSGWNRLMEILSPLGNFLNNMFVSIWQDMINPALTYIGDTVLPKLTNTFEKLWNDVLVPLGNFCLSVLKPIIEAISDVLSMLWQEVVVPLADAIGEILAKAFEGICDIINQTVIPIINALIEVLQFLWDNVFSPITDFLWDIFKPVFEEVFNAIGTMIGGLKQAFSGLIDFIVGIFTGDWERAWQGIKDIFTGIWSSLESIIKIPINATIAIFEGLANKVVDAWNHIKETINSIQIDIPDWLGGGTFGFNLPMTEHLEIPRFAEGGFPDSGQLFIAREAGAEFVGNIGGHTAVASNDQIVEGIKNGVKEAVAEILAPYLSDIANSNREIASKDQTLYLGDREVWRASERGRKSAGAAIISTI